MKKLSSLRTFLSILMLGVGLAAMAAKVDVLNLKTENLVNPLGIDTAEPRFSWQLQSEAKGVLQTSSRLIVASSAAVLGKEQGDLWVPGAVS